MNAAFTDTLEALRIGDSIRLEAAALDLHEYLAAAGPMPEISRHNLAQLCDSLVRLARSPLPLP